MRKTIHWGVLGAVLLTASSVAPAQTGQREEGEKSPFSAGIVLSGEASSKSIGLPIMPGAVRREKKEEGSNALTFALWGGEFGFRVSVLQLATTESVDQVATFYKSEMTRYGTVLECSREQPKTATKKDKTVLECDDKPKPGRYVLKVGTPNNHRLVNIEPSGKQVHIDMVRVVATD